MMQIKTMNARMAGIVLVTLATLAAPAQSANLTNGSFETGSFASWNTLSSGDQAVVSTTDICGSATPCSGSPTNGSFGALLTTPGTANVSSLESFLGLVPGNLLARNVTGGSAISQTFTLNTGGILSFDWNFLTNETLNTPTANDDFASFFLNSEVSLGSILGSTLVSSGTQLFDAETGFNSVSLALGAGTYTLKFLVADRNDITFQSGLLVDNVRFVEAVVPEPSSMLGMGSVLAFGLFAKTRRGKSAIQQRK
jgi:PEP-CTERM motif